VSHRPRRDDDRAYRLTPKAVHHIECHCPLSPGHDGPCQPVEIVPQGDRPPSEPEPGGPDR